MKEDYGIEIGVGGATAAAKGASALRTAGIPCRKYKLDALGERGCSFAIAVRPTDAPEACEILRDAHVAILSVREWR